MLSDREGIVRGARQDCGGGFSDDKSEAAKSDGYGITREVWVILACSKVCFLQRYEDVGKETAKQSKPKWPRGSFGTKNIGYQTP